MDSSKKDASLKEFLSILPGSREVGLVIAKDAKELKAYTKFLEKEGYSRIPSVFRYEEADHGWYLVPGNSESLKPIYDFVCQYPTTLISLYEPETKKLLSMRADWRHGAVIVLTEEALRDFQAAGLDLLGRVGPAYRLTLHI